MGDPGFLHDLFCYVFVSDRPEVHAFGAPPQTILAPDGIDGPVVNQRKEEGSEGAAGGVEGLGGAPQGQERVVHHLLGETLLPGDPVGQPEGRRRVPSVQLLESLPIAEGEPVVEIVVPGIPGPATHAAGVADATVR